MELPISARLLYVYCKNKSLNNGSTYWECEERRSGNGCNVKVVLDDQENFLRKSGEHTHPADPDKVEAMQIRSGMKRGARETNVVTNNVIATNMAGANESTLAKLPKMETMRRDVRRQRRPKQNTRQYQ